VQQIKILQKTLKVTDDSYRGTLETSYGKRSSKELTETQALEVIARMRVKADALEEGVRG
jgi:phage gp16-like protein